MTGPGFRAYHTRVWDHLYNALFKPDNIPLLALVFVLPVLLISAFRQARRHDRLIDQGQKNQLDDEMRL